MNRTYLFNLPATATAGDLFSCIRKLNIQGKAPITLMRGTKRIYENDTLSCETLKDLGIGNATVLHSIERTVGGGGYIVDSFSSCDECLLKYSCQFTRSKQCTPDAISKLIEKRENAYLILCQKFNISNEVIRAIEDNTESNAVRLADVLHHIYHKDPSITLQQVNGIVSENNVL